MAHAHFQLVLKESEVAGDRVERLRLGVELDAGATLGLRDLGDLGGHVGRQVVQAPDSDGVAADRDDVRDIGEGEAGVRAQHVDGGDFGAAGAADEGSGSGGLGFGPR